MSTFETIYTHGILSSYSLSQMLEAFGVNESELSEEKLELLKHNMYSTENAYLDSPSDAEGKTPEQMAVSNAILENGLNEFLAIQWSKQI